MIDVSVQENQVVVIILVAILLLLFMSVAIVTFFYFSRKKIVKSELEKARLAVTHQRELLQSTIVTQEEERKRIAQDMHDAISSKLNIVSLNANFLKEENIDSKEANALGESIVNVTATVLESARRIAHDLLPPALDKFGLVAALEELCDQIETGNKHQVFTTFNYASKTVDKNTELHIFRIVQELINNTVKYGNASRIEISLTANTRELRLLYADNGTGFIVAEGKRAKGLGLSGIENRAALIDGEYTLESQPGEGMKFKVLKHLDN